MESLSVEIPWETIEEKAKAYQDKNSVLTAISINTRNESGAVTGLTVSMEDSSFELKMNMKSGSSFLRRLYDHRKGWHRDGRRKAVTECIF